MSGLRSKSAPSVLRPQYTTADTVIANEDVPDPSALRTFSNASTVKTNGNGGESKFYDSVPEFRGEEVPQSDYETMAEREAAENAATKIQSVIRGRNSRKRKGGRKKKSKRKTRKKKRSRKKKRRRKRRKTRRKKGAFDPISDFKKSVDKTEMKKQADLFNKMKRARIEGNTKKQEELKRHMKKSFDRMIYWKTREAQANAARIIDNKLEQAMPEINKSIRRGLLRPQKQPKTGRNPKQPTIGGKRRRKTKRRKR